METKFFKIGDTWYHPSTFKSIRSIQLEDGNYYICVLIENQDEEACLEGTYYTKIEADNAIFSKFQDFLDLKQPPLNTYDLMFQKSKKCC